MQSFLDSYPITNKDGFRIASGLILATMVDVDDEKGLTVEEICEKYRTLMNEFFRKYEGGVIPTLGSHLEARLDDLRFIGCVKVITKTVVVTYALRSAGKKMMDYYLQGKNIELIKSPQESWK